LLKLENIKKDYLIEGNRIEVLKGVSLEIKKGEKLSLTGKSGAGKSTLLNIIATLERPDSGTIIINGGNPLSLNDRKLSRFRNREIGIVFQFHYLLPEFTALENVALPLMMTKSGKETIDKAAAMLEKVGLSHRMKHKPAELSGGEQQRVAIARALVTEPGILLLDEPTGNLDSERSIEIMEFLSALNRDAGITVLMVTHEPDMAAFARTIVHFKDGLVDRIEQHDRAGVSG